MAGCRALPAGLHRIGSVDTAFTTDHALVRGAKDSEVYVRLDGCVALYEEYYSG